MPRYVVAPGRLLTHGAQPPIGEGAAVPADLLAEWGETGLQANLEIGAVIEVEHEPAPEIRRARR